MATLGFADVLSRSGVRYQDRDIPWLAWLYRIAHARVVDHYRRVKRTGEPEDIEDVQVTVDHDLDSDLMLNFQQQKNQINLQVRNAAFALQQARAGVEAASAARNFAMQSLDAEQKKYDLGTSTIYFVLQAQQDLVTAQNTLVQNSVQYRRNLLNLSRRQGTLLDEHGIVIQ